jgi:type VI secretion system protein ImpM
VLSPGICGPWAVVGLWMPSSDRVGRCYPLTFAATACCRSATALLRESGCFLAVAEAIGRDTLESSLSPAELASRIAAAATAQPADPDAAPSHSPEEGGLWWTTGGPLVSVKSFTSAGLPDESTFFRMLSPCIPISPVPRPERDR